MEVVEVVEVDHTYKTRVLHSPELHFISQRCRFVSLVKFFCLFFSKRLRLLEDFHAPALTTAMLSQMVARILLDISFGC